jgi:hypothetical protein
MPASGSWRLEDGGELARAAGPAGLHQGTVRCYPTIVAIGPSSMLRPARSVGPSGSVLACSHEGSREGESPASRGRFKTPESESAPRLNPGGHLWRTIRGGPYPAVGAFPSPRR